MMNVLNLIIFSSLIPALILAIKCPVNQNIDTFIEHENDTTKYYACLLNGTVREIKCDIGFIYNPILSACVKAALVKTIWKDIVCLQKPDGTLIPNYENLCRSFFECTNGSPSEKYCAIGLFFDVNNNYCNWADQVQCECTIDICPNDEIEIPGSTSPPVITTVATMPPTVITTVTPPTISTIVSTTTTTICSSCYECSTCPPPLLIECTKPEPCTTNCPEITCPTTTDCPNVEISCTQGTCPPIEPPDCPNDENDIEICPTCNECSTCPPPQLLECATPEPCTSNCPAITCPTTTDCPYEEISCTQGTCPPIEPPDCPNDENDIEICPTCNECSTCPPPQLLECATPEPCTTNCPTITCPTTTDCPYEEISCTQGTCPPIEPPDCPNDENDIEICPTCNECSTCPPPQLLECATPEPCTTNCPAITCPTTTDCPYEEISCTQGTCPPIEPPDCPNDENDIEICPICEECSTCPPPLLVECATPEPCTTYCPPINCPTTTDCPIEDIWCIEVTCPPIEPPDCPGDDDEDDDDDGCVNGIRE